MVSEERDIKIVEMELGDAEKKLNRLFGKRNEWNKKAEFSRNERNSLNGTRRKVIDEVKKLRDDRHKEITQLKIKSEEAVSGLRRERDRYNTMVKMHKRKRQNLKKTIDSQYEDRDKKPKKVDPIVEINMLTIEMQELELKFNTTAMKMSEETKTMDRIKEIRKKIQVLERLVPEHQKEEIELLREYSSSEDTRRDFDLAHHNVVDLSNRSQQVHETYIREKKKFDKKINSIWEEYQKKIDEKEKEIDHLKREADRRHKEHITMREKADHYHKRAVNFRDDVLVKRKERDKIRSEMSKLMDDHNRSVHDSLESEEKKKETEENAMDLLKAGKKITL